MIAEDYIAEIKVIPIIQSLATIMSVDFVDSGPESKVRRSEIFAVCEDLRVATHPTSYCCMNFEN
jgi:hypothetical protein